MLSIKNKKYEIVKKITNLPLNSDYQETIDIIYNYLDNN